MYRYNTFSISLFLINAVVMHLKTQKGIYNFSLQHLLKSMGKYTCSTN